jgi:transposase
MNYVKGEDRNQISCIYCLDDDIAQDNIVRLIDILVDRIILENPDKYRKTGRNVAGRPAFSPSHMLKLFLYGYLNQIPSSRRLANECRRNIEVMWLLNNVKPKYRVIADFRKDNYGAIKEMTITFRIMLKEWSLIAGKLAAIDGTKIKGNTKTFGLSKKKIEKKIEQLSINIVRYLQILESNDRKEELPDNDDLDDDNPDIQGSLRKQIEKLESDKKHLEDLLEKSKSEKDRKINPTDPDARAYIEGKNCMMGYSVQAIVDSVHKLIMATHISGSSVDINEMIPAMETLKEETGIVPEELIADNGYENTVALQEIEAKDETKVYVMGKKEGSKKSKKLKKKDFIYDEESDTYTCPAGNKLTKQKEKDRYQGSRLRFRYRASAKQCNECSQKSKCTSAKKGRNIYRYLDEEWIEEYHIKMNTNYAKSLLKRRKGMIEHVFGVIKCWMGKIPLLMRGKQKVETEINLYATAYNLRRIISLFGFDKVKDMIMGVNLPFFMVYYYFSHNRA